MSKGREIAICCCILTRFFPVFPLDPLKTSENVWFSDVFMAIKRKQWEGID